MKSIIGLDVGENWNLEGGGSQKTSKQKKRKKKEKVSDVIMN